MDTAGGTAAEETSPLPDDDGPVNESDALLSLSSTRQEAEEREEAEQAASIADLIAERLREQSAGLSIHNLTLFNDSVSFGGGFAVGGPRAGSGGLGAVRPIM